MSVGLLELIAVVLGIAYLLLASRENILCWYCAFVSSLIFSFIFWDVSLLMESLLNIFYVVMAVVGWMQWRQGSNNAEQDKEQNNEQKTIKIKSLSMQQHIMLIGSVLLLALLNGWFMQNYTSASWPFVDSFTTWASIVTTIMVIRKVLENWIYWFVIDGISIVLYVDKGLYLAALLYAAYVVIVVFGYFSWRKLMRAQTVS